MSYNEISSLLNRLSYSVKKHIDTSSSQSGTEIDTTINTLLSTYGKLVGNIKIKNPDAVQHFVGGIHEIAKITEKWSRINTKPHYHIQQVQRLILLISEIAEIQKHLEEKEKSKLQSNLDPLGEKIINLEEKIKKLVKQSKYESLIENANKIGLPLNWVIGAAYVCLMEAYIKKWLKENLGEDFRTLKNKPFQELISMIEKTLEDQGIQFEQKKLSDMAGRQFRNKVIHELYVPTDNELKEVLEENTEFINYFNSLKK